MSLEPIVSAIKRMQSRLDRSPRFVWASVVSTDPLTVWVDGDEQPLAASPALATLTPRVGSRVYCVMQNGRATVVGVPDIVAPTGVWWRGSTGETSLGSASQRLSWGTDSSSGGFSWEPGGATTLAVGEPGMYAITFQAAFNNSTGRRDALLLVNDAESYRGIGHAMVGVSGQQTIDFTVSRYLDAGDTVAIVTQGGGSITMLDGNFGPRFEVSRT